MSRTLRACIDCGVSFYGGPDKLYCDACSVKRRSNVIRIRTCRICGVEFPGGPRAFYCPNCRKERQKEAKSRYIKNGSSRKIGSIDHCQLCGAEYSVTSGRQKYCSEECQRKAVLNWQREHKKMYLSDPVQRQKKNNRRSAKMKICKYCGRKFQSTTSTNLCSDYCRKKQQQINMRNADIKRGRNANIDVLLSERESYRNSVNP